MCVANPTAIGQGCHAVELSSVARHWDGWSLAFHSDDIRRPTDWSILLDRHSLVVHLAGAMDYLETELEDFGGSIGAPLPGEVWSVPAGRRYASHAKGGVIRYAVIQLDPDFSPSDFGEQVAPGPTTTERLRTVAGEFSPTLFRLAKNLHAAFCEVDGGSDDKLATDQLELMTTELSRHLSHHWTTPPAEAVPNPRAAPRLSRANARALRNYIHKHLDTHIVLDDLVEVSGLTPHHLLIAFRKAFGTTPAQYVLDQRLRRARHQLATTDQEISVIALDCGFSSHSHLTASFRRRLAVSPGAWRRLHHRDLMAN